MSTYRENIYIVLDELKLDSDDATFNEDHVSFLMDKYRSFILKQRYSDIKKEIPESNYQTICLDFEKTTSIEGIPCGNTYLKSTKPIPYLMNIGNKRISTIDYYLGEITYVTRDRMRYVGFNKYLQNIVYASLNPNEHLYMISNNPQFEYLEKGKLTGIFEDSREAAKLECDDNTEDTCDPLDRRFPLEEALIPIVLELITKELRGPVYSPKDETNNAEDDLSNVNIRN